MNLKPQGWNYWKTRTHLSSVHFGKRKKKRKSLGLTKWLKQKFWSNSLSELFPILQIFWNQLNYPSVKYYKDMDRRQVRKPMDCIFCPSTAHTDMKTRMDGLRLSIRKSRNLFFSAFPTLMLPQSHLLTPEECCGKLCPESKSHCLVCMLMFIQARHCTELQAHLVFCSLKAFTVNSLKLKGELRHNLENMNCSVQQNHFTNSDSRRI